MLDHVMMLLREMQDFYKLINEQKNIIKKHNKIHKTFIHNYNQFDLREFY